MPVRFSILLMYSYSSCAAPSPVVMILVATPLWDLSSLLFSRASSLRVACGCLYDWLEQLDNCEHHFDSWAAFDTYNACKEREKNYFHFISLSKIWIILWLIWEKNEGKVVTLYLFLRDFCSRRSRVFLDRKESWERDVKVIW